MDFDSLLQQGSAHAWLYLPVAVLLGALHGLEPGHSKTMMAAFIVAVRGTIVQAVLLGLSAAISHSLVIWALAALALRFGDPWRVETAEPYFLIGTGAIVIAMALWTLWRLRRGHHHHHDHHHDHHHHHEESHILHCEGREASLSIFEDGVPPRFRIATAATDLLPLTVTTRRAGGESQTFALIREAGFWQSTEEIPEPHEFEVEVAFTTPAGERTCEVSFEEHSHDHDHDHHHHHHHEEDEDEHTRQHAEQIRRRFDGREVTTPQIVLFGLTGGLMPCPAALSILLICLQLKRFTLGFSMVAAFSLGLAITLVAVGVAAAWGIRRAVRSSGALARLAQRAPQLSSYLLILLGAIFVGRGCWQLG